MNFAKYKYTKKNGITKDGHTMFEQDIVSDLNRKSHLEEQLQQYKSIVKTVDADNLPKFDVLALNKDGEILEGRIYTNYVNGVLNGFMCESDMYSHLEEKTDCMGAYQEGVEAVIYNVTHYIEAKDIIKLLG